jgi:glutamate-ammonia-ligase adenylyltransferase
LARVRSSLRDWDEQAERLSAENPQLAEAARALARDTDGKRALEAVFGHSPFLTHCALAEVEFFVRLFDLGPSKVLGEVARRLKEEVGRELARDPVMAGLRRARRQAALAIATADITGHWHVDRQVEALSAFADQAVSATLAHLLRAAAARDELELADPEDPEQACGYVVLGMGKLGARELNYSSDIDLIVVFDPERTRYRAPRGPQDGFVRVTRDLARILEDRTADGYVLRVDLRLRPDPAAMPLAISFNSAMTYYESLGQNWERAAMIKARPIAGDRELGAAFLRELRPFVWRKNLDFWAIQDIHSIKRQIHAHRGGAEVAVLSHNIKLGRGGIREIELYAQTQQLIWGGRDPSLRTPRTQDALDALAAAGHIPVQTAEDLKGAYRYLRRLEHRLQMVEDQQTQTLPKDEAGLARLAAFMGKDSADEFRAELVGVLRNVENHYADLFEESPALAPTGNLVFTGGEPEPGTLETLANMGFQDGTRVFNMVRAWHHGRHRATRSTRSRQLLTELMPTLLQALGRTTQPDNALLKFDEFLSGLPAGVQLFSMLHANPSLLDLLAEVMGGAPALADRLSRNPDLLETVLSPGFFDRIPEREALEKELARAFQQARDYQDELDIARRWANDRRFQAGLHILRHAANVDEAGRALSDIADTVLRGLYPCVLREFASAHGNLAGPGLAVIAMGKLGAREMTVASDLDLVFIYEAAPGIEQSDGSRPLEPVQYFGRLSQRYISALTALTPEGSLYEIDMRLRPSGNKGPVASTLPGWQRYYEQDAWTWEHMALTRARVVAGDPELARKIEAATRDTLCAPRDDDKLLCDIADMRQKVAKEHPAESLWSVKYLRGGLMDLEFLAEYLILRHARQDPALIEGSTQRAFAKLAETGILDADRAKTLIEATRLIREVQGMLRLIAAPAFDADQGTESLKASLARAAGLSDFDTLRTALQKTAETVHGIFVDMIEEPARRLAPAAGEDGAKA